MAELAPTELYAFGNRAGPRRPRVNMDVFPDATGMVGPESLPYPKGPSTFAELAQAPLKGHYHILPAGTPLPEGLGVVADGADVNPNSRQRPSHHTIYPAARIPVDQFCDLYLNLPWQYGGRK